MIFSQREKMVIKTLRDLDIYWSFCRSVPPRLQCLHFGPLLWLLASFPQRIDGPNVSSTCQMCSTARLATFSAWQACHNDLTHSSALACSTIKYTAHAGAQAIADRFASSSFAHSFKEPHLIVGSSSPTSPSYP